MLDERLALAASLYEPCELGADVGTDHALLPCHLLEQGVCRRMILSDVSPGALAHAQAEVARRGLGDRAEIVRASGLDCLKQKAGCVSVTGLGGETIAGILRGGASRLEGAVLVLSAHTDLPLVRAAVRDIGYHLTREELCRAAGRFYVVWRAEAGYADLTQTELQTGPLLLSSGSPLLPAYVAWRLQVLAAKREGILAGGNPDRDALRTLDALIARYRQEEKKK